MSSILISIPLGIIVSCIKEVKVKIVMYLIFLSIFSTQFLTLYAAIRPSITLYEYYEMQNIILKTPKNSIYVVPDIKLKYWVETLTSNVVKSMEEVGNRKPIIFIFEKIHGKILHVRKNYGKIIYDGKYLIAYMKVK